MGYFWLWISCFDFGYFCYDDLILVVMSNSRRLKMKRGRILYRSYCRSCASWRAPRGAVRPSYYECVASGWLRVGWIRSEKNLADLFTKVLGVHPRNILISRMLNRWLGKGTKEEKA